MTRTHVTEHAALRWTQRVAGSHCKQLTPQLQREAVNGVIRAYHASTQIPRRFVDRIVGRAKKGGGVTYHMTTSAVLLVRGHVVITVYPWCMDSFAEVMVHAVMGLWAES